MKILAIMGSYRKGKTIDTLIDKAKCVISDDMNTLNPKILEADGYIFGTPVFMAHETAIMKQFLERICWIFAKPAPKRRKVVIPKQCPEPRSNIQKKAIIITSSGIIKPRWKKFCDDATPLIKETIGDSLNAKVVGTLYAGAVMKYGAEKYYDQAYELGKSLASQLGC